MKAVNYQTEWSQSCVAEELTHLNVIPLEGYQPLEYLLYADTLPRCNSGRVSYSFLKRYQHLSAGGWWCSGIDILTGNPDHWGCFKPERPRHAADRQKPIKYEHPPKIPTGIFALRVPLTIWQRIATRYGLPIAAEDIKAERADLGFWEWVTNQPKLPLCITEGAKKAGALLSAGYVAIALPGINGGYRISRDEYGRRIGKPRLIPQLQKLAIPNREIYLAFDRDTKPATVRAVNTALQTTGSLLSRVGCCVKVMTWNPEAGKGIDDLIAVHGQTALDEVYQKAISLEVWKAQSWYRLTYTPAIEVNHRYLPPLSIPETAKLIAIKSPKGTGKTQLLEGVVQEALLQGKKVLVIGHRVRLVEALCQRFGLQYVAWGLENATYPKPSASETAESSQPQAFSYGLCIDSLHPQSQAAFYAEAWSDGIVIIDEVEQVLWHGLNSSTCSDRRVAILKSLKTLMQNVLGGGGQVFVADADLSDTSIDYLISLSGVSIEPYVILNNWKPEEAEAWTVYSYQGNAPHQLVQELEEHIREGGRPLVCLGAQKPKSVWGTRTLEAYFQRQFPQARILRLDSESLADPTHPAFGSMSHLNEVLQEYDIVLASPSIETGISIEIRDWFTSVWAIAQGIQEENSVRQALGRLRQNVPRYIWIANQGFNFVGNGSTSIPALLNSDKRLTQLNIRLLQQSDFEGFDDLEMGFQAESLLCWAKMAVRLNSSMLHYRESVVASLMAEGHDIINVEDADRRQELAKSQVTDSQLVSPSPTLTELVSEVRDQNYRAECEAVALAPFLSDRQYRALNRLMIRTTVQRRSLRHYELKQRYGIPITAELVAKDDAGWYQQIRLHYFLTVGRDRLSGRDAGLARSLMTQGDGQIFLPDFNRSQLGAVVGMMDVLGVPVLLRDLGRSLKNTDTDLQAMADLALSNRSAIKTVMGIGLAKNSTPIEITRRFLNLVGYSLTCIGTESYQKKRFRVYQVASPDDGRWDVFQNWLVRNEVGFEIFKWETDRSEAMMPNASPSDREYIQLSLFP